MGVALRGKDYDRNKVIVASEALMQLFTTLHLNPSEGFGVLVGSLAAMVKAGICTKADIDFTIDACISASS